MFSPPKISIVVPSLRGRGEALRTQLERQSFSDWELFVQSDTRPPARARNEGARSAGGEWLLFMDDDIRLLDERLLERLASALEAAPPQAMVYVPVQPPQRRTPFQERHLRESFKKEPVSSSNGGLFSAISWRSIGAACLAIRRQTFQALGGFDERLPSAEDVELALRLTQSGGQVLAFTKGRVEHASPPTFRETLRKRIWYERGNAQVARKHPAAGYRIALPTVFHAAGYLLFRTVALLPLCFFKISYYERRPRLQWRPLATLESYVAAWAYVWSWFSENRCTGAPVHRSTRIKVFYLINGLYVGGAERAFLQLTRHLDRSRFEPVICTLVGGELIPQFEQAGVRVLNLRMRRKWDLLALLRLWRWIRQEKPDVLHTRLLHADILGRLFGRLSGVPVILSTLPMVEPYRHHLFWKTLDRWSSRWADVLVALSEQVKRDLVRVEGLDPAKFRIIPNAIKWEGPSGPGQRERKLRQLGLPEETFLVGIIARLYDPIKGHRVLFEAIRRLAVRYPRIHCVVIGEGKGRPGLEAHVRSLGLSGRVTFTGVQYDVENWLSALDLFVLPSFLEGFPMAIVEAMAAGKAIIATPVNGVPDLITNGQEGLLVTPGQAGELAEAIERLLNDPVWAGQLGRAARRKFEARFDLTQVIHRTYALYEEFLKKKLRRRLRVLEVITTLDSGGSAQYLVDLVRWLPKDQYDITVVSGPERLNRTLVEQLHAPHRLVCFTKPMRPLQDLRTVWQLFLLMRRGRFDIVHLNTAKADLVGGLAARLCGVPCIVSTAHGPTLMTLGPSLIQWFFDRMEQFSYVWLVDKVIGVSHSTTRHLIRKRSVKPDHIETIQNGIELERIRRPADREAVRARWGVAAGRPVIAMVGRFAQQKAQEVLIQGLPQVRAEFPDLVCLLIGEGPRKRQMEELTARLDLTRNVRFLGDRDDVAALLSGCDLFVLSTHYEGMSIAVLEAMAAGLPVVASGVEGMEELVEHGRTGLLFTPGDPSACAQALLALLRDPSGREAMGRAGLEKVCRCHTLDQQVRRTDRLLQETFHRRRIPLPGPFAQPAFAFRPAGALS